MTPHLRRFARALVRGHDLRAADDLVQETVALILRARGRRSGSTLMSCLAALIRIHRLRERQEVHRTAGGSRPDSLTSAGGCVRSPDASPGTAGGVQLDGVPLEGREVLLLVVLAGLTYGQAADLLGVTREVVIARLGTARDRLGQPGARSASSGTAAGDGRVPAANGGHLRLVK